MGNQEGNRGQDLGDALQDWDFRNLQDDAEAQTQVESVWDEVNKLVDYLGPPKKPPCRGVK